MYFGTTSSLNPERDSQADELKVLVIRLWLVMPLEEVMYMMSWHGVPNGLITKRLSRTGK